MPTFHLPSLKPKANKDLLFLANPFNPPQTDIYDHYLKQASINASDTSDDLDFFHTNEFRLDLGDSTDIDTIHPFDAAPVRVNTKETLSRTARPAHISSIMDKRPPFPQTTQSNDLDVQAIIRRGDPLISGNELCTREGPILDQPVDSDVPRTNFTNTSFTNSTAPHSAIYRPEISTCHTRRALPHNSKSAPSLRENNTGEMMSPSTYYHRQAPPSMDVDWSSPLADMLFNPGGLPEQQSDYGMMPSQHGMQQQVYQSVSQTISDSEHPLSPHSKQQHRLRRMGGMNFSKVVPETPKNMQSPQVMHNRSMDSLLPGTDPDFSIAPNNGSDWGSTIQQMAVEQGSTMSFFPDQALTDIPQEALYPHVGSNVSGLMESYNSMGAYLTPNNKQTNYLATPVHGCQQTLAQQVPYTTQQSSSDEEEAMLKRDEEAEYPFRYDQQSTHVTSPLPSAFTPTNSLPVSPLSTPSGQSRNSGRKTSEKELRRKSNPAFQPTKVTKPKSRPTSGVINATPRSTPRATDSAAEVSFGFVNFTANDEERILSGVAPSGSSKTKERREQEERDKHRRISTIARQALREAGKDPDEYDFEGEESNKPVKR
ncbi:hypothetical protein MMC09_005727 [Bachmanniomyces sp. S44760]|nr:hypothetical protein [Bachmanniomyces sp. S44760]